MKRPQASGLSHGPGGRAGGWSVYEDLKLLSYGSHMIFFLLLPPVVKLFTTKVDVIKDDTLGDSYWEETALANRAAVPCVPSSTQSLDPQLVDIYSHAKLTLTQRLERRVQQLRKQVEETKVEKKSKSVDSYLPTTPEELMRSLGQGVSFATNLSQDNVVAYKNELEQMYESYKLGEMSESEYCQKMMQIIDQLPRAAGLREDEVYELFKVAFTNVHQLKLTNLECELVGKAIMSSVRRDMNQKKYEISRRFQRERIGNKKHNLRHRYQLSSNAPDVVDHCMRRSGWLQSMAHDSEMYVALSEFASVARKSTKFIRNITEMFADQTNKMQNYYYRRDTMEQVIRNLVSVDRCDEAKVVLKKLEKMYGRDVKFLQSLHSKKMMSGYL